MNSWLRCSVDAEHYDMFRLFQLDALQRYETAKKEFEDFLGTNPIVSAQDLRSVEDDLLRATNDVEKKRLEARLKKLKDIKSRMDSVQRLLEQSNRLREKCDTLKANLASKIGEIINCERSRKVLRTGDISLIAKFRDWKRITIGIEAIHSRATPRDIILLKEAAFIFGVTFPITVSAPEVTKIILWDQCSDLAELYDLHTLTFMECELKHKEMSESLTDFQDENQITDEEMDAISISKSGGVTNFNLQSISVRKKKKILKALRKASTMEKLYEDANIQSESHVY